MKAPKTVASASSFEHNPPLRNTPSPVGIARSRPSYGCSKCGAFHRASHRWRMIHRHRDSSLAPIRGGAGNQQAIQPGNRSWIGHRLAIGHLIEGLCRIIAHRTPSPNDAKILKTRHTLRRPRQPHRLFRADRSGRTNRRLDALHLRQHQRHPAGSDTRRLHHLVSRRGPVPRPHRLASCRQGTSRPTLHPAFSRH